MSDNNLLIQSTCFVQGIPKFVLIISDSLLFETFHLGIKCYVSSLTANRVTKLDSWSKLEEAIRFLNLKEACNKTVILYQQIESMAPRRVGLNIYSQEAMIRAFEYFATSRALYNRIREDYQLPSIQTLTRITSSVSKLSECTFLGRIFKTLEEKQKICVLLHDEIYVKKMMLYHGGTLFGRAVNNPDLLANTVLGIMIVCLYGGPKFLSKMLPVAGLKTPFLRDEVDKTKVAIKSSGGDVTAIICDGNRTNQSFIKSYTTLPKKTWLTTDNTFLLYDYVHLIKGIRNNWLTEKNQQLVYEYCGVVRTARWSHLKKLHELESRSLVKMSKLTEVAVYPKPVERQKVSTVLKVFCDETYEALLKHPGMQNVDIKNREETALFLRLVIDWWTIMNVKGLGADVRHNNRLERVIDDPTDSRLDYILHFGEMCQKMAGRQGKRVHQLTRDTGRGIFHTCNGVVDLCKHLLINKAYKYVPLGKFTTDFLEKAYGKLRQGSGGTYFITVQQIMEKVNIKRASLLLSLDDIEDLKMNEGHHCNQCSFLLDEEGAEIFDNLINLESSIPLETKMTLVYIAGYVSRKDGELSEDDLLSQTTFYHQKYGDYTDSLDRGGLNIPSDCCCQWTFFSFILFHSVKKKVCRKSLNNIIMLISEFYGFNMQKSHGRILANIFLKNYCVSETPTSTKESSLKLLKLSVSL